jgi:hypothetical protein
VISHVAGGGSPAAAADAASYFLIVSSLYAAVKVRRFGWADRGPPTPAALRPAGVSCMSD